MKNIYRIFLALCLCFVVTEAAAQTATDFLDDIQTSTQLVKQRARSTKQALRNLAVDYFQLGNPNPNVAGYLVQMNSDVSAIENELDNILDFAQSAYSLNNNLDFADIVSWVNTMYVQNNNVFDTSDDLQAAIASGDQQGAQVFVQDIRFSLNQLIQLANLVRDEAEALKSVAISYNVRIELVDNNGQPVGPNGLQGYYAQDLATGQYIYPDYYTWDQFLGLPGGTYTFGAFNGYFDGASSNTVTLDPSLVGSDGFIVVQLVYWSE